MIQIISKEEQAFGAFNGGEIVENKPIGFNREGGKLKAYSSLFYWANAIAKVDSTIGLHPHQGFEIMSFVLEGEIRHFDTKLNEWIPLNEGDAQVIRAGNGISHSEFIAEGGRMFQIWLDPNLSKTMEQPASYDDFRKSDFNETKVGDISIVHYVGKLGKMRLDTPETTIQRWRINVEEGQDIEIPSGKILSFYALTEGIRVNGSDIKIDDFVLVEGESKINVTGTGEVFVIYSPKQASYPTYAAMMQRRMSR